MNKYLFSKQEYYPVIKRFIMCNYFRAKNFLLFVLFCTLSYFIYGQDKAGIQLANKIEPIAKEYYRISDFSKALEGYLILDSIKPGNTEYNYRIGICYLNSSMKSKAYPYLEFAYFQPDAPENIFIELGRAYHHGLKFDKALIFYESYKKQIEFNPEKKNTDVEQIKDIGRFIQMCRNGERLIRVPLINCDVMNLGPEINSEYADFGPLVNQDEDLIIFSSKRKATTGTKSDPLTDQYYENILFSRKSEGFWASASSIGPPLHHNKLHDAALGLSPNGNELYIYTGDDNAFSARVSGNIYVSSYKADKWTEPVLIEEINTKEWESSATISGDGTMLIFSSDRPGGFGGTDLYQCRKTETGSWSEPQNMGGYINTRYDDDGPFIHPSGNKLYFSSKGHNSMGGYDIFYTQYLDSRHRWTRPVNIGYPINSPDDDIFFVWSPDGERAYFSSEREDTFGDTDIYMLHRNDDTKEIVGVTGEIIDGVNKIPIPAELMVRDLYSNNLIGIFGTNKNSGNYSLELISGRKYSITIKSDGYQDLNSEIELDKTDGEKKIIYNFTLRQGRN